MDRKDRQEPEWVVDEASELVCDAAVAKRYGFATDDITMARNDLIAFLIAFYSDPFHEYDEFRLDIGRLLPKVRNIQAKLDEMVEKSRSSELAEVLGDIGKCAARLVAIQGDLPQRPHYIQRHAIRYLMAVWRHADRKKGFSADRRIVISFNGDNPIHDSMKFILEMLRRTPGGALKSVGRSTIMHSRYKKQEDIPPPSKVYAFKGHPRFL